MDAQELVSSRGFEVQQMQRRLEELAHRLTEKNSSLDAQKEVCMQADGGFSCWLCCCSCVLLLWLGSVVYSAWFNNVLTAYTSTSSLLFPTLLLPSTAVVCAGNEEPQVHHCQDGEHGTPERGTAG
jgi:hypothetical protein